MCKTGFDAFSFKRKRMRGRERERGFFFPTMAKAFQWPWLSELEVLCLLVRIVVLGSADFSKSGVKA